MALTPQEMQKRLELALKTGAITQAQFNAKLADIAAQSRSVAPAAAGQGDRNARPHHSNTPNAGRNVGATSGRPRFDNSAYATAPYRFVNFDSNCIVLAEDEARTAINIPKKNGLSAVIDVEWEAESPFLIGAQPQEKGTEPSIVTPLTRTGGGVDYYIPGATLKGAIRSVAEIAAGARLSQVNQDRVFPLRDLNHGL